MKKSDTCFRRRNALTLLRRLCTPALIAIGCLASETSVCCAQERKPEVLSEVAPGLFQGDKSFPETKLELQDNFVEIRIADASRHPMIRLALPTAEAVLSKYLKPSESGKPRSIGEFGIRLAEIESIHTIPSIEIKKSESPNAERPFGLSLGGKDVYLQSQKEIQWPQLIKALPLESLGFQPEQIDAWAGETAEGRELLLQKTADSVPQKNQEATKQLYLAYELVAGGFATAVISSPTVAPAVARDAIDSPATELMRLANHTRQIAVGIDHDRSNSDVVVHAILVVREGNSVDNVLQTVLDLQTLMLDAQNEENTAVSQKAWLSEARIRPDDAEGLGAYVDIELRFKASDLLKAFR